MRRLSAEEAALWRRVATTVRREASNDDSFDLLIGRPGREPALGRLPAIGKQTSAGTASRLPKPQGHGRSAGANTLDASWDRKLANGRAAPERSIDLHGLSLSAAHARLDAALSQAVRDGIRVVLVVTGRAPPPGASRLDRPLRGVIRASIGDWLAASPHARDIAAIRHAHPRHGGAGALYVILRRPR